MKLSKRERVLICILIFVLIFYAGYKFIPTLNLFNLEVLKTEYNLKSIEYNNMSQNIVLKSKYEEQVQTLSQEINDLNVISNLQQEQLIVFLNTYFANNNIDANNISFTEATVVPMDLAVAPEETRAKSSLETLMDDINNTNTDVKSNAESSINSSDSSSPAEQDNTATQSAEQASLTVTSISVNVAFESTYDNMIKFIDAIQNNFVDISITNINSVATEGDGLQTSMTLNLYEVPKPIGFEEFNVEWIWKDLMDAGKKNPFSTDRSFTTISGSTGGNFDFFINLEPESSDLPTVLLGKTEDTSRSTYISEDTNAIENVKFNFKSENNKYYYKYSTKSNSYPKSGEWIEFSPVTNENIRIRVYSNDRSSNTDSAGVNIEVSNTSGLKVYFEVENDLGNKPRVTFKDPKSVVVTRK